MRCHQRGEGLIDVVWLLVSIAGLMWFASSWLPADAQDVQAVVTLAEKSPEAKADLAAALKAQPNPDRGDLAKMTERVNEILVTEQARVVTGNKDLKTPTQMKAEREAERKARAAVLDAKQWSSMSDDDKGEYILNHAPQVAMILGGMLLLAAIALRPF